MKTLKLTRRGIIIAAITLIMSAGFALAASGRCASCKGSGTSSSVCRECKGSGIKSNQKCPACQGKKFNKCTTCDGKGKE